MNWYVLTPDGKIHDATDCKTVALEPAKHREHTDPELARAFEQPLPSLWLVLTNWARFSGVAGEWARCAHAVVVEPNEPRANDKRDALAIRPL